MEKAMQEKDLLMVQTQVIIGDRIGAGHGDITAAEHDEQELNELADAVRQNLVTVDPSAPSCCIDGRHCLHTKANAETTARPSVAGGGAVTAFAAAELVGWFGASEGTTQDRFTRVDKLLNAAGLPTGGHTDKKAEDAQYPNGRTGCGANDRLLGNIGYAINDTETTEYIAEQLLGQEYDVAYMKFRPNEEIQARNSDWNAVAAVTTIEDRDASAVEVLYSDESPTHGHEEVFVVFNYNADTTVDRDALVEQTGEQAFVIDMWYIDKMAKALATGPEATSQEHALKHAMVAYQIGTYLSLCDGKQRPLILTPEA